MSSGESSVQLRPSIAACLEQYARKRHTLARLRAIGLTIVFAIAWLIVWGLIDRFLIAVPSPGRLFLLIVWILFELRIVRQSLAGFPLREVNWLTVASEIEAHDSRFGETLLTVVSESLSPARHRASAEMVDRLAERVDAEIHRASRPAAPPVAAARLAAAMAAVGLAVFVSLFFWPRLGMQQLVARQILPLANFAPVKTTHLSVQQGSVDWPQGSPFTITAAVEQLRGSTVILRTTTDHRNWSGVGMTPSGNGLFTHTLPAITRDLTFQVTAGDAASEPALVRVLRPPLVRDFRIHLSYPAYVAREALNLTTTSGAIQAPSGTEATIVVTASEPLKSATFIIDGKRMDGKAGADGRSRQVQFKIDRDAHWQLEMLSERGVPGNGPGEMPIHAIPDRAPIARLLLPQGALFLRPQDLILIPYQAADDYALGKLEARIIVNNAVVATLPLSIGPDPQRVRGAFPLDLSKCKVSIGDLVMAMVAATDRANPNQTTEATACQVLISTQPVTSEQRRRVALLRQAAQLASSIVNDLDFVESSPDGSKQINSRISSAGESASLLVQSLLGADVEVQDPQLAKMLAVLADRTAVQAARLEQLAARIGAPDLPAGWLARARNDALELQMPVVALWKGLSSEVIVAEQAGLNAARAQTDVSSLREDVDVELHELEIDPQTAQVSIELQSRMADARRLTGAVQWVDWTRAAAAWAAAKEPGDEFLSERLSVASQAEALRAGGNLDWARDLQIASRAVRAVESRGPDAIRTSVADDVAAIERDHRFAISAGAVLADADQQIRAAASSARKDLSLLAGETPPLASTPAVQGNNPSSVTPRTVASTQETDTREQMLSAIRQAQEDLAVLPLQLGQIEQSVQICRQLQGVAGQADRDAQAAALDQRSAARRAAEIAHAQSDEAFAGLSQFSLQIDPNQLHDMLRELQSFGADTSSPATAVARQLEPALAHLRERIDARDPDGIDQSIVEVRNALSISLDELRHARQAVLEKDPLVAARWFARQEALAAGPASRPSSTQPQNETLALLGRAWDDSLQRATAARLAAAPATQPTPGFFEPGTFPRPWLDPDLVATMGASADEPPQFKEALRAYFKVLGRPDADVEP